MASQGFSCSLGCVFRALGGTWVFLWWGCAGLFGPYRVTWVGDLFLRVSIGDLCGWDGDVFGRGVCTGEGFWIRGEFSPYGYELYS